MTLQTFVYEQPDSLEEACRLLGRQPGSAILAGGTDLVVAMKRRTAKPSVVIDLKQVPGLNEITVAGDTLRIGTLVSLDDLGRSPVVADAFPMLSAAVTQVASPMLRNLGTVGGNLCVDTRCRFFNQSEFWRDSYGPCYKAGGTHCHVTTKEQHCSATYSGDLAPVLLALGAQVTLAGPAGQRTMPLADFFTSDGKYPNLCCQEPQILVNVEIPLHRSVGTGFYRKVRYRGSMDFPLIGLACWLRTNPGGVVEEISLWAVGVGSAPVALTRTAGVLHGQTVTPATVARAARATDEVRPLRTGTVGPTYKRRVLSVSLAEGLCELFGFQADELEATQP